MISIPGSSTSAKLVMTSSAPAKSAGDARYASQDPYNLDSNLYLECVLSTSNATNQIQASLPITFLPIPYLRFVRANVQKSTLSKVLFLCYCKNDDIETPVRIVQNNSGLSC